MAVVGDARVLWSLLRGLPRGRPHAAALQAFYAPQARQYDSFRERLLVDAKSAGVSGGLGIAFDWRLVEGLARARPIILAGGLTPENVERAVEQLSPWGVDVAGGVEVEGDPRRKDAGKVRAFIQNARREKRANP